MHRDAFSTYHPLVNLAFFVSVIGFAMFLLHPVALGISFVCAAGYVLCIKGKKALRFGLIFMLPMLLFTAAMNPLFNHQGVTIVAFLPNGNPVTREAIIYGIAAAIMLITVITWFACVNAILTGDKMVYLFGRVAPALSLILSMSLRFVPRFIAQAKIISNAQKALGRKTSPFKILSMLVSWALENAIETADSMKARGYGLPNRTAFSIFTFTQRDALALLFFALNIAVILAGVAAGAYRFRYFPDIQGEWTGAGTLAVFTAYFLLCAFPLFLHVKEALYWKRTASVI
ncbi:MAG: energy-coupling factor transporter transmembrane protein EcfT [Defluviitaleaceae bacterium]|nr:energy-coupling factor transporter transmembrane protein EcfT [Defluviitaleaceae bacterium]